MLCSKCGTTIDDGASFCAACGEPVLTGDDAADKSQVVAEPSPEPEPAPTPEPESEKSAPSSTNKRRLVTVIVALVVLIAAGAGAAFFLWNNHEQHVKLTPVQLTINAAGYDDSADSKIPLSVNGTVNDGTQVNQTIYVDSSGQGLDLRAGTYAVTVPASPLTARGILYRNDDVKVVVTIGESGLEGDPSSLVIDLPVIDGKDMTADRIAAAEKCARESGMESGKVDTLVKGTKAYMDEHKLVTFSYSTVVLEEASQGNSGFNYIQFSCDDPTNTHVAEVNERLKSAGEQAYALKMPDGGRGGDFSVEYRTLYDSHVSYFDKGYASVVTIYYVEMIQSAHGSFMRESHLYNLMTGEELSPAEFVGLTDESLNSITYDAVDTYLQNEPYPLYKSAADLFRHSSVSQHVSDGSINYFVLPDGLYAWFATYTLGSFAEGTKTFHLTDMNGNVVFDGRPSSESTMTPVDESMSAQGGPS